MKKSTKLEVKDLIIAGAFAALYVITMLIVVSFLGFVVVLYLMAPLFLSIILGPIYMLYTMKIPKRGAIMILAVLVGLVTSMGGAWMALIWAILCGLVAEILVWIGQYKSKKLHKASYMAFALTSMGPLWMIVLAKPKFLEACTTYYGSEYAAQIDKLTPSWIVLLFIAFALIGGFIGATIGAKLLKKHFIKAGVV